MSWPASGRWSVSPGHHWGVCCCASRAAYGGSSPGPADSSGRFRPRRTAIFVGLPERTSERAGELSEGANVHQRGHGHRDERGEVA